MNTLLQDLRYAVRQLFRNPGFTLVAVLASWLPARSATRVDPVVALRAE